MTSLFHPPYRTDEEIAEHKALRTAEAVVRKLEGLPEPKVPPYQGKTPLDHARHRELEIDITTDLGYGDPKAIRLMKHHASEAVSTAAAHARQWEMNTEHGGSGGINNLFKHVTKMIEGLRSRANPVLKVAEAEFDPSHILRGRYNQIESVHLDQVQSLKRVYDQMRDGAGKYARSKIRPLERKELQDVLNSMAKAVCKWDAELNAACKEAGLA